MTRGDRKKGQTKEKGTDKQKRGTRSGECGTLKEGKAKLVAPHSPALHSPALHSSASHSSAHYSAIFFSIWQHGSIDLAYVQRTLIPRGSFAHHAKEIVMPKKKTAVIAGVGPGLGAALARKFAAEGCQLALLARSPEFINRLSSDLKRRKTAALAIPTDISDPLAVIEAFRRIRKEFKTVDILVNHASASNWKSILKITPQEFERAWRVTVFGALLCAQQAVCDMISAGQGVILFTGATSAIRGRKGAPEFSSAKFALRGLAWSLASELWPKGIHVAHVIIDGMIDTPKVRAQFKPKPAEPLLKPDAIAESYWHLIQQDRSAWSFELDLRPHQEEFFT
jgi:NAD(P)-dependent dehydrogenase (short-subunit alcohol dehydrogenase family)